VWQSALLHPERVGGVIGVNTPFFPRLPIRPTDLFRSVGGDNNYIVFFQQPGVADELMASRVRGVFTGLMQRARPPAELAELAETAAGENWVEAVSTRAIEGEPLMTGDELEVYIDTFERTGFTGGINWYRNFDRNWELTPEQDGAKIDVPCLMVTAEWDPVLTPAMAQGMDTWIADLETHQIDRCGHWTQQEEPDALNRIMLDWLGRRFPT
jgi:pimeloyl-ACP methyl ester carboxylesterase